MKPNNKTIMKTNSTADAYAHGRFLVYLDLILDPGIGAERKNFCLHEIWKDGLWKSDFRSIGEFAKATHMHTSQLFKRIGAAQVHLQMVDAGMVSNRPTGREVELLLRVPPGHRVDAWRAVIEKVKERGNSNAVVRETLSEYANRL
jgi:hypothetical protein